MHSAGISPSAYLAESATPAGIRSVANDAPPSEPAAPLSTQRLGFFYGKTHALHDISLEFAERNITAIIGPSGSGKSTLLACLNRLYELTPGARLEGRVIYRGEDIHAPGVDTLQLRRRIGMIFQRPNPFPMSIRANIELPLKEHGVRDRAQREHIMETVLREVGLWSEVGGRLRSPAPSLSGGQQQRLCIARAIALEPDVLLLDEPCSALDPVSSGLVESLIRRIAENRTVVLVTHHLAQARRLASRTALLWPEDGAGRVIECDATERCFESPKHEITAAYIAGRAG